MVTVINLNQHLYATGFRKDLSLARKNYCSYTRPLGNILRKYNIGFHMYADDTQLYVPINTHNGDVQCAIDTLENCVCEVRKWMKINFLK